MNQLLSFNSSSTESDTPAVLNSTELSGAMAMETLTIFSVPSPEPQIVMIDSNSNDPTISYSFGSQHPIVPPSVKDLNLPPNPFNVLATMAVIRANEEYSPQSTGPSIPSPNPTPSRNVSTIEGWEKTHTTMDDNTFFSEGEPRRVYCVVSSHENFDFNELRQASISSRPSSTPPPPRRQKRKLSIGMSCPQTWGVPQHTCEACGQPLLAKKHPNAQGKLKYYIFLTRLQLSLLYVSLTILHIYGYVSNTYP